MKKNIFAIVLASLSLNCYALPTWFANVPTCAPYQGDDLTACFLNKTGKNLSKFIFQVTGYYKDGAREVYRVGLGGNVPDYYTSSSSSKAHMEKQKIEKYEFSILNVNAQAVQGCNIEVTTLSSSKQELTLRKDGDEIHC